MLSPQSLTEMLSAIGRGDDARDLADRSGVRGPGQPVSGGVRGGIRRLLPVASYAAANRSNAESS